MNGSRYLCLNPECTNHALIHERPEYPQSKDSVWAWKEGFGTALTKMQLSNLGSTTGLCRVCEAALQFAPPPPQPSFWDMSVSLQVETCIKAFFEAATPIMGRLIKLVVDTCEEVVADFNPPQLKP